MDKKYDFTMFDDDEVTQTESIVRGLGQGVSLGFSDEILASGRAVMDDLSQVFSKEPLSENQKVTYDEFGRPINPTAGIQNYEKYIAEERHKNKRAEEANPKSYLGGEVLGGVATAWAPGLSLSKSAKLGEVLGKSALGGGLSGAGLSEASDSKELMKDVATGAGLATGLGATFHGVGKGLTKLKDKINFRNKNIKEAYTTIKHPEMGKINVRYSATKGRPRVEALSLEGDATVSFRDVADNDLRSFIQDSVQEATDNTFAKTKVVKGVDGTKYDVRFVDGENGKILGIGLKDDILVGADEAPRELIDDISNKLNIRSEKLTTKKVTHPEFGDLNVRVDANNKVVDFQLVDDQDLLTAVDAPDVAEEIDDLLKAEAGKMLDPLNKGFAKVSSFVSGIDEEAIERQIQRPYQTLNAEADDFVFDTSRKALNEIQAKQQTLGRQVGKASDGFLANQRNLNYSQQAKTLATTIDDFLARNAPSTNGFSALKKSELEELQRLSETLKTNEITGEDFFKLREYLDTVKNLAKKYDKDEVGPFINFLKQVRHQADQVVDEAYPPLDQANQKFAEFKNNQNLLGLKNEKTAESYVDNLYGRNKKYRQKAANELLSPNTLNEIRDVAANKAFNAQGGSGSQYGLRNISRVVLGLPSLGVSELLLNPEVIKYNARALGKIQNALKTEGSQALGKFAKPLAEAAKRGNAALSSTHFILSQQNQEYRKIIEELDKEE